MSPRTEFPLEPGPAEMREMAQAAAELLVRFVERLPNAPSADLEGAGQLARELRAARPPLDGVPLAGVLATVERAAASLSRSSGMWRSPAMWPASCS